MYRCTYNCTFPSPLSFPSPLPSPPSRDLPIPLLSREYLPAFASIADIDDLKEQVRTLNLLVLLLPSLHQKVLKVRMGTNWNKMGTNWNSKDGHYLE